MKKICRICGKEFFSTVDRKFYCSEECYYQSVRNRSKENSLKVKRKKPTTNMEKIAEINRKAVEMGMSYGDYVIKYGL